MTPDPEDGVWPGLRWIAYRTPDHRWRATLYRGYTALLRVQASSRIGLRARMWWAAGTVRHRRDAPARVYYR